MQVYRTIFNPTIEDIKKLETGIYKLTKNKDEVDGKLPAIILFLKNKNGKLPEIYYGGVWGETFDDAKYIYQKYARHGTDPDIAWIFRENGNIGSMEYIGKDESEL